jgi:dihydroorotate dehydrogenase
MLYRNIIKPLFFLIAPEKAHYLAMDLLHWFAKIPGVAFYYNQKSKRLNHPVTVAGITFPNPIGLAAGFDKNGKWINELSMLGFGHIEVGTVTPMPQPGNEKPRLFRLPTDSALINRMGFNNDGMQALSKRLKKAKPGIIIGGNIGKNKWTPNESATSDYLQCFEKLHQQVHYFVVNVSSPNTPGLRALQEKEPLLALLNTLQKHPLQKQNPKPIFLKIAPDLGDESLGDIIEVVQQSQIAGIIACNTTIERGGLATPVADVEEMGAGGVSGKPAQKRALEIVSKIRSQAPQLAIIGVGGIFNGQDARAMLEAGANLVQVYTGFIYEGPNIALDILAELN